VVRREVCRVTSLGTRTFGFLDADDSAEQRHLYALCQSVRSCADFFFPAKLNGFQADNATEIQLGICFVDTSVGTIRVRRVLWALLCCFPTRSS